MSRCQNIGLVVLGTILNLVELLLRLWGAIVGSIMYLLEDAAEIIEKFLIWFGILYGIINILCMFIPNDIGGGLHLVIIMAIAFAIIIGILRLIGDICLTTIASFLNILIPFGTVERIAAGTMKLRQKHIGMKTGKFVDVVEKIFYWCGRVIGTLIHIVLCIGLAALGGYLGYCLRFVWGPPPAYLALDWYFCVGFAVLIAGTAGYIGFTVYNGFKSGFLMENDNECDEVYTSNS